MKRRSQLHPCSFIGRRAHGVSRGLVSSTAERLGPLACVLACLALPSGITWDAAAAPVAVTVGFDHYSGPNGQETNGAVGAAALPVFGGGVSLAGVRYHDSLVGNGVSVTAGGGFPVGLGTTIRAYGTRYVGDEAFHAWRFKAGPEFHLAEGRAVGIYYARYADNGSATSNGAVAEMSAPLRENLSGRVSGAFSNIETGPATDRGESVQGTVGLTWTPIRNFQVLGDLGIARNGASAAGAPFPSSNLLGGLPVLGGDTTETNRREADRTGRIASIGLRLIYP